MGFISVKTPSLRVPTARQTLKLLDAALGIVASSQFCRVIADHLVESLTESLGLLSSSRDKFPID
jgi:hypothetical protein